MRFVDRRPDSVGKPLRRTQELDARLASWLTTEFEDAISARQAQEQCWRDVLRLYEGVPKNPVRNTPVENAPNTQITIGAIAADSLYAQAVDLIFSIAPTVTVRPMPKRANDKTAKQQSDALQRFANWGVANEFNLRQPAETAILDDVQLGTGALYIPFIEEIKKTDVQRVVRRGPRIYAIAPEDVVVPGGADSDPQTAPWVGIRFLVPEATFKLRAQRFGWDGELAQPIGVIGWVRTRREQLGRTTSSRKVSVVYEIVDIYCHFDYDNDDEDEDLLVTWDRGSRRIMALTYNPFDRRPLEVMRYQKRAHLFNGLGVLEMLKPFQEEVTDIHNERVLNMMLANARFWKARTGSVPENMRLWPNRVLELDEPDSLQPEQMGDIYPSSEHAERMAMLLAERRVGVNEMSSPRPSQVMGSRTPGITSLSLLQQANRRFTPAFDGMRLAVAGAVRQCLYRYQERLLGGDDEAEDHIIDVLGQEDGMRVIALLRDPNFDESVSVELTASSASVNREVDRQNALMLMNVLTGYYERTLQLVAIAAQPQTPQVVKDVARKIASAVGEAVERTIRQFEQVRDPQAFIVQIDDELDRMDVDQQGLQGLIGLLGRAGAGQPNGGLPAPEEMI